MSTHVDTLPTRLPWPDLAKGIAMLLVVVCHTGEGVYKALGDVRPPVWLALYNASYRFMVPAFFVLAGGFAARAAATGKPSSEQWGAAMRTLLYPYLVWSTLQFGLALTSGGANRPPEWNGLPAALAYGWAQYWFLHALLLSVATDLALRGLRCTEPARAAIGVAMYLLSALLNPLQTLEQVSFNNYSQSYVFFAVGGLFWRLQAPFASRRDQWLAPVAASAAFTALAASAAMRESMSSLVASLCGVAMVVGVARLSRRPGPFLTSLVFLGRYSLGVYCLHVIVAAGLRTLLMRLGLRDAVAHIALGTVAALVISLPIAIADERWRLHLFRLPTRRRGQPKMMIA